jgi:transcriptional regulator with XRE-family HTH domain
MAVEEEEKDPNLIRLGQFVTKLRQAAGWSVERLAREGDLDSAYVKRLEYGEQLGSLKSLGKVARALGVVPGVLANAYFGLLDAVNKELNALPLPDNMTGEERKYLNKQIAFVEFLRTMNEEDRATTTGLVDIADRIAEEEFAGNKIAKQASRGKGAEIAHKKLER